jgi:hypothetical protein
MNNEFFDTDLDEDEVGRVRAAVTAGAELDDDLLIRVGMRLSQQLSFSRDLERETTALLERRLRPPMDVNTWPSVETSLTALLEDEAAGLFLSWLLADPTGERIAALDEPTTADAARLASRLRGLFAPEIEVATAHVNLGSDDWFRVDRLVYVNQERGTPAIRTTIEKVNGETLIIDGTASSLMNLTRVFLNNMLLFRSQTAFAEDERGPFLDALDRVRDMVVTDAEALPDTFDWPRSEG